MAVVTLYTYPIGSNYLAVRITMMLIVYFGRKSNKQPNMTCVINFSGKYGVNLKGMYSVKCFNW